MFSNSELLYNVIMNKSRYLLAQGMLLCSNECTKNYQYSTQDIGGRHARQKSRSAR